MHDGKWFIFIADDYSVDMALAAILVDKNVLMAQSFIVWVLHCECVIPAAC